MASPDSFGDVKNINLQTKLTVNCSVLFLQGIKDDLEQEIWKIENETEELKFEFYDAEKVRKRKEQM